MKQFFLRVVAVNTTTHRGMDCVGLCWQCPTSTVVLANAALVYTIACVGYLILTRSLGTPFKDSLSADQRSILAHATEARTRAFYTSGFAAALIVGVTWRKLFGDSVRNAVGFREAAPA